MVRLIKYSLALCIICMSGTITNTLAKCSCDETNEDAIETNDMYFKSEKRNPQTIIYDIVSEFLSSDDNMKEKKVLLLGYDGFREDALENIFTLPQSGIKTIMDEGGLYHSYAGFDGNQETSTAPGWLSILSGTWAYELGVLDNNDAKSIEDVTILDEATTLGYSSAFISSWSNHFEITYRENILHPEPNMMYQQTEDDDETIAFLQEQLANTSANSYDVFCGILEYTDHAGHSIGYGNQVSEYIEAAQEVDTIGYELLQTIHNRESYDKEEWLIIITTDHGGIGTMHGGQSEAERNTWFAINKKLSMLD